MRRLLLGAVTCLLLPGATPRLGHVRVVFVGTTRAFKQYTETGDRR